MTTWTDDKVKLLATLMHEGWSRGQIADIIGVTRNAVAGKLDRLGQTIKNLIDGNGSGLERPPRQKPMKVPRAPWKPMKVPIFVSAEAEPAVPPVEPVEPVDLNAEPKPITLLDLRLDQCRWPTNDGWPQFHFCGKPTKLFPYCAEHRRKAFGHKASV